MRALVIDETVKQKIAEVIKWAESHVYSMDDLLDIHNKELAPSGDEDNFTCYIPNGYKTVFSIEKQPMGKCRHLSVSVDAVGKLPSIEAVEIIMQEYGFKRSILLCSISMEEFAHNHQAINIIEPIK